VRLGGYLAADRAGLRVAVAGSRIGDVDCAHTQALFIHGVRWYGDVGSCENRACRIGDVVAGEGSWQRVD
jgi:hypothetical protein